MRLVVSSDWHVGRIVPDQAALDRLIAAMVAEKPDGILVLGDFTDWHDPPLLRDIFAALRAPGLPVGVVFGNHDVWLSSTGGLSSSWQAWRSFSAIARASGVHPLDEAPLQIGDVTICGTGGWYDYTFGSPLWSTAQYATKQIAGYVCQDRSYVRWQSPDPVVAAGFLRRLAGQLARVPSGNEVVVVTHVLAFSASLGRADGARRFLDAFLGSKRLGDLLGRHGVALHVHGHLHRADRDVPERAGDWTWGVTSYNATYTPWRPYLVVERAPGPERWTVRAAE